MGLAPTRKPWEGLMLLLTSRVHYKEQVDWSLSALPQPNQNWSTMSESNRLLDLGRVVHNQYVNGAKWSR